jgi:uncharacterized protein DUF397
MVARPERESSITWRKSRRSADTGNCVEIAENLTSLLVRDSRDPSGPVLVVTAKQWRHLVVRIQGGDLHIG